MFQTWGLGGGLVDRAADLGLYDPSSIPLGEKKENKQRRGWGWSILKKMFQTMGSGCSTGVEYMPCDGEVVGSTPIGYWTVFFSSLSCRGDATLLIFIQKLCLAKEA